MDLSIAKRPSVDGGDEVPAKTYILTDKQDVTEDKNGSGGHHEEDSTKGGQNFTDLSGFTLKSVLSNSADVKRLTVEGTFPDGQSAVIVLDKQPFAEYDFKGLFSDKSKLNQIFQNDIYGNYECLPPEKISS